MANLSTALRILKEDGPAHVLAAAVEYLARPHGFSFSAQLQQTAPAVADPFDHIYAANGWLSGESRSGPGSERSYTAPYREQLTALIGDRGIRSMFDAPCGDLNWIWDVVERTGISYIGGDIAEGAIADARRRVPQATVSVFDIAKDAFPQVDLWHCRDCLFHLSFEQVHAAFDNFLAAGIPFALITTHKARYLRNRDIAPGGFRYLDLQRAPFGLPKPLSYLSDYRKGRDFPRFVALWSREQVEAALS